MPSQLDLPEPAQADPDSMLSRRFGREVTNYFSGSPLNRLSFLRTNPTFLSSALRHPSTSFLLCNALAPLAHNPSKLAYASFADVRSLIGDDVYSTTDEEAMAQFDSSVTLPQLVFLGLDESNPRGLEWKPYAGAPLFALDVSPKASYAGAAESVIAQLEETHGLTFLQGRMHLNLPASEGGVPSPLPLPRPSEPTTNTRIPAASIYAHARSVLDWNARNPFCGTCGQPTLSTSAGHKRACPPSDASLPPTTPRRPCSSRGTLSNLSFPRTDPTIIVAVLSSPPTHVLLGRQARFPPNWYSTLAGFLEPGESVEDAVRREVWEEAGVAVGRVVLHSSQPWPYPANLMIGAIAQAVGDEGGAAELVTTHDPELEEARWVSVADVAEALRVGTSGIGEPPGPGYREGGVRLPPPTAIANRLLTAVVEGWVGDVSGGEEKKGEERGASL
ncbi:MAG: NADH pyrophosphatase [Piccolia ochrophora]|nr:MAG: NADH pyrophosphatase [Piccolia ochrophora]